MNQMEIYACSVYLTTASSGKWTLWALFLLVTSVQYLCYIKVN